MLELLPDNRRDAIAFYSEKLCKAEEQGSDYLEAAERWLALNDLFFLMVYVMKRVDINRDWLFDRCREVQAEPNGFIDLWSREHYKSTIITVGLTIQDILNDPNVTVGIFSHTRPIAKAFLRQIGCSRISYGQSRTRSPPNGPRMTALSSGGPRTSRKPPWRPGGWSMDSRHRSISRFFCMMT